MNYLLLLLVIGVAMVVIHKPSKVNQRVIIVFLLALITAQAISPVIRSYINHFVPVWDYIAVMKDAADDVQDVIDENKDALNVASPYPSNPSTRIQYKSLAGQYLTRGAADKIAVATMLEKCINLIKLKNSDAPNISSLCIYNINDLKQQIAQELIGLKYYKEKQRQVLLAKKEVGEIYDDMLNKINKSAYRYINTSEHKDEYKDYVISKYKDYAVNGRYRDATMWVLDKFANDLTPIDEFNKIINKLIKVEKRKATEILDKLNSEEELRKEFGLFSLFLCAKDTQAIYDSKIMKLNKILSTRDPTAQQEIKSKLITITRIDLSTTTAHASEDEYNNSVTQLERNVALLYKGIYQLDSAIQYLNKRK